MARLVIAIEPDDEAALTAAAEGFVAAARGKTSGDRISFSSPAQLFGVLTPKRWELIERLQKAGPMTLRGLARLLGRDVKRVHEDIAVLTDWHLVVRNEANKLIVPYDEIHAGFDLVRAA